MRRRIERRSLRARSTTPAALAPAVGPPLPPRVTFDPDQSVGALFEARSTSVLLDHYMGVPLLKFPEDLRVYEHLLRLARPDVVIELGTNHGGSALWFRDRLRTLASYGASKAATVITVDVEPDRARGWLDAADPSWASSIHLLDGDVLDATLVDRVAALIPKGARCFVTEDTAHRLDTTAAALDGFHGFVPPGGFFVVEDAIVDDQRVRNADWPRGVADAIQGFLDGPSGHDWSRRVDLELYGLSNNPGGVLQRQPA